MTNDVIVIEISQPFIDVAGKSFDIVVKLKPIKIFANPVRGSVNYMKI